MQSVSSNINFVNSYPSRNKQGVHNFTAQQPVSDVSKKDKRISTASKLMIGATAIAAVATALVLKNKSPLKVFDTKQYLKSVIDRNPDLKFDAINFVSATRAKEISEELKATKGFYAILTKGNESVHYELITKFKPTSEMQAAFDRGHAYLQNIIA
ncbi:unknown [Clostridium sp. CAG:306]|nr:unknown [Clostridium sp. CAG:306]